MKVIQTTIPDVLILEPQVFGDERGFCGVGRKASVSSFSPHFGEEDVLVGENGSGTIFFSSCSLRCCFCQNYEISFSPESGQEVNSAELAAIMLDLQQRGCHNINFVSPSHVVVQILEAIDIAVNGGLCIPLIYNSSGYDSIEALELLENVVDIYMPDFKFWQSESGKKYCNAPDYPEVAQRALLLMHQQVGDLKVDENGLATKGLLIRHLLMPEAFAETQQILRFVADKLSKHTYVNLMDQYRPCGKIADHPELQKNISAQEHNATQEYAAKLGLTRIDERDTANLLRRLGIL
jgi:putative pyruvate formate lyase activating enzyme